MADKLLWTEPTEITERKLREETLPWLRKTFKKCTLYLLMAGIPLASLGYFVQGIFVAFMIVLLLVVTIYQIPFLIWMNIRLARKSGVKNWMNSKGMQINQNFYLWRDVEGYDFSDTELRAEVGTLKIKLRSRKEWWKLSFYRQEVDEQTLRVMLERFALKAVPAALIEDRQYLLAKLEQRKEKAVKSLYLLGMLSFVSGGGLIWSIKEWLNLNSHNTWLLGPSLVTFPYFLVLFFFILRVNKSLYRQIQQAKDTSSRL